MFFVFVVHAGEGVVVDDADEEGHDGDGGERVVAAGEVDEELDAVAGQDGLEQGFAVGN